jgi:hypothetical protein
MSAEEQEVANSFSGGEAGYNKIYEQQEFYLVESNSPLLLEASFGEKLLKTKEET